MNKPEKVTLRNTEVKEILLGLDSMSKARMSLNAKTIYALARNHAFLTSQDKVVEEARKEIIRSLGSTDDAGVTTVTEANQAKFNKQYEEVLLMECEVPVYKLKLEVMEEEMEKVSTVDGIFNVFNHIIHDAEGEFEEEEFKPEAIKLPSADETPTAEAGPATTEDPAHPYGDNGSSEETPQAEGSIAEVLTTVGDEQPAEETPTV